MKLYEINLRLTAGVGTPLAGDTIFGQFCWQAAHNPDLLNGGLERWIAVYGEQPFAVFSSAFPCFETGKEKQYALKRPDLPLDYLLGKSKVDGADRYQEGKGLKKTPWLLVGENLSMDLTKARLKSDGDLHKLDTARVGGAARRAAFRSGSHSIHMAEARSHNTINRLTGTTGTGPFAPFAQDVTTYFPETGFTVFVLLDEKVTDIERVRAGFENIGRFGFGRDASTGLGRFTVTGTSEKPLPKMDNANACYTLGPCLPEKAAYHRSFFTPFVRFGKHGDELAAGPHPFKNPVLMAGQGAVFIPENPAAFEKPYIGRAISGVSLAQKEAVVQGYSIYLPFRLEADHEE